MILSDDSSVRLKCRASTRWLHRYSVSSPQQPPRERERERSSSSASPPAQLPPLLSSGSDHRYRALAHTLSAAAGALPRLRRLVATLISNSMFSPLIEERERKLSPTSSFTLALPTADDANSLHHRHSSSSASSLTSWLRTCPG